MKTADNEHIKTALSLLADEGHPVNLADAPGLHPFPARMPLRLAEYLLESTARADAAVLDPMMGSGSTLIAARRRGHASFGVDIDPLAVVLSRCSTNSYTSAELNTLGKRVLRNAIKLRKTLSRSSIGNQLQGSSEEKDFLKYWFSGPAQRELFCLRQAIQREEKAAHRDIAWAAFSSLIIAKEAGVSYAIDVPRSRPHKDDSRELNTPFEIWLKRFDQAAKRLPFLDREPPASRPQIKRGDARNLTLPDNSIDLVLTSPPYLTAIDYLRGHKFSLVWMGHSLRDLRKTRGEMIGSERGMWKPNGLPQKIEKALLQWECQPQTRAICRRYLSDIRYSMIEMKRVLRRRGLIAMVLGPKILSTDDSDSLAVTHTLAKDLGLEFVASVLRPLKHARRSLPPPDRSPAESALAARMSCEAIAVFRKAG